jgi:shikimate kinase
MKENGRIVLLSATPETIYERVRHSKDRPILNGHMYDSKYRLIFFSIIFTVYCYSDV